MANTVSVSGMFGAGHTYFAGSPVVIDISGLDWPSPSPFKVVRIEVGYDGKKVGDFRAETGGQTEISFDISSALRAIWSDYDFNAEASSALSGGRTSRGYRAYTITVYTEYIDNDGAFVTTSSGTITGGQCAAGWLTEWERSNIGAKENADASHWQHSNPRNGDASTKPTSSPERVGSSSITSWVDVDNNGTSSRFYTPDTIPEGDDETRWTEHPPLVLRDSQPYVDFLFVNRRGAIETCSGLTLEDMEIEVTSQQYAFIKRPSFRPSRSLMAISWGGRKSWSMSSGIQTRDWAEWWTEEFLVARQWWMLYKGRYVPVVVKPSKNPTVIYNRAKQDAPHVDFTVTLALDG